MNKDRLIELLELPYNDIVSNSNIKDELIEYYKFIYGEKGCSSCKDKFNSYYKKLMNNGVELLSNKVDTSFKLRDNLGVLQINFGDGTFISQTYAPDDLCIGFLKANPARISMFSEYPENWKELIQNNDNDNENE